MKNWIIESCVFESYIPQGNWRFDVQYFTSLNGREVPVLRMIFYIDVRSDVDTTMLEEDEPAK